MQKKSNKILPYATDFQASPLLLRTTLLMAGPLLIGLAGPMVWNLSLWSFVIRHSTLTLSCVHWKLIILPSTSVECMIESQCELINCFVFLSLFWILNIPVTSVWAMEAFSSAISLCCWKTVACNCDIAVISWVRLSSMRPQRQTLFWMMLYMDCDDVSWTTVTRYRLSCGNNAISAVFSTTTLKQLAKHFKQYAVALSSCKVYFAVVGKSQIESFPQISNPSKTSNLKSFLA